MKNNLHSEILKIVKEIHSCGYSGATYCKEDHPKKLLALIKKHERVEKDVCTLGCTKCVEFMANISRSKLK